MKTISQVTAFILILFMVPLALMAQSEKAEISTETKETIDQVNRKLVAALENGDLNKVMDLYADDATLMLPGGKALKGKKQISEYLAGVKRIKNVKINTVDAGGSGKIIYQVGKATFTNITDGKDTEETTDFVMVLKRQAGWDYKISVNSSN